MQPKPYTRAQKWLHLLVVVFLVLDVTVQAGMTVVFRRGVETGEFTLSPSAAMHFLIGIAVLLVVLARLVLVREQGGLQGRAARPFQAIYGALILVVLSGVIAWGLGSPTTATLHHFFTLAFYGVVLVHAGSQIFKEIVNRNNTLAKMFSGFR